MGNIQKKRDESLDAIKGFCIILVVLGHVITYLFPDGYNNNLIFKFCYSFHMPAMIFISAYLSGGSSADLNWFVKKAKRLMIPFIIWTLIEYFTSGGPDLFKALFFSPSIWFLHCLFCFWAMYLVADKTHHLYVVFLLEILVVCGVFFFTHNEALGRIIHYCPFFILGVLFRRNVTIFPDYTKKKVCIINIVLYVVAMFLYSYNDDSKAQKIASLLHMEKYAKFIAAALKGYSIYIVGIIGIGFVFSLIKLASQFSIMAKVISFLAWVGLYSMQIYLLHWRFLFINTMQNNYALAALSFILGVFVPIFIGLLVKKIKPLSQVLFGN
ncbi:MAG: acyltransferase family protein [Saccharofermentans sp.]|nr:acyltransferase family protein [Saccharofermentans sp.]